MSDLGTEIENLKARLKAVEDQLLPPTWVGEPVWYCSGGKDCCEYEINTITKVDAKKCRIKVKCDHASEWIYCHDFETMVRDVTGWIAKAVDMRDNPENYL